MQNARKQIDVLRSIAPAELLPLRNGAAVSSEPGFMDKLVRESD